VGAARPSRSRLRDQRRRIKGFVTDTLKVPAVPAAGAVSQPLLGLWNGTAPTTFTKVSGDAWLDVTADGTVTGTAPDRKQQNAAEITVSATSDGTTSTILVEVPVADPKASLNFKTATWNAWDAGSKVTYVDYKTSGGLELISSDTLFVGRPSATNPSANSWPGDHAAVVTTFHLTTKSH
jgi:hypothetical protein